MQAQLVKHEFKEFISKAGKPCQLNEYKFVVVLARGQDTVKVNVWGPCDNSVSVNGIYEITPEAYATKDDQLAWGTKIQLVKPK